MNQQSNSIQLVLILEEFNYKFLINLELINNEIFFFKIILVYEYAKRDIKKIY